MKSLELLIGEESFREVSKVYLNKHLFKTATTNDLISVFEDRLPNINIRSFLESFLFQEGYPIMSVNDSGDGLYTLEQVSEEYELGEWLKIISWVFCKFQLQVDSAGFISTGKWKQGT